MVSEAYQYKYNGKEFQDELGLNFYDYGARNYDSAIGRWMNIDPLADKFPNISSFAYVANNPIVFIDPDGKDIYRYDSETGGLVLMKKNDDHYDQIGNYDYNKETKEYVLKTDKGKAITIIENIAKGILKDGINFRKENNLIPINGTNDDGTAQPTEKDVIDFIVSYSDKIAKVEVSGYATGMTTDSEDISAILVWQHKNNRAGRAEDIAYQKNQYIPGSTRNTGTNRSAYAKYHFHTHPRSGPYGRNGKDVNEASDEDFLGKGKRKIPHFIFNLNGKHPY